MGVRGRRGGGRGGGLGPRGRGRAERSRGAGTDVDFAADHGVDQYFGFNVFLRDGDRVYRTYFVNARGAEPFTPTWAMLDLTPLGRQEDWEDTPPGRPQEPGYTWWGRPDEYA